MITQVLRLLTIATLAFVAISFSMPNRFAPATSRDNIGGLGGDLEQAI